MTAIARPPRPTASAPAVRGRALAGTAVVVLGVATGKWGAYLGVPPLFLTDVLLGLAIAGLLAARVLTHRPLAGAAARGWPGAACGAFLLYVGLRFVLGLDHSLIAIRDFAPYGYAIVAFLAASAYCASVPAEQARTGRILRAALLAHLAWVLVMRVVPAVAELMPVVDPVQDLRLFSVRGSTDATVAGVTAALYLIRFLRVGQLRALLVVVLSMLVVVTTTARSALLGTVVALLIALWLHHAVTAGDDSGRRRLVLIGLLPVALVIAAIVLPQTAAGGKLLVGFELVDIRTQTDASAIGTARGRTEAWDLVLGHVADQDATIVGVGFGPDFLADSGGRAHLGNGVRLRSPHNYLIGTYARLGLVGLGLLLALLAVGAREVVRLRARAADDFLLSFAVIFPVAFFVSAVFGVELETPFGAVPFFWCLGVLLSRPRPEVP